MQSPMETVGLPPGPSVRLRLGKLRYFEPRQYETVCAVCDAIVPADDEYGGAIDAGVPEFIDLLVSENRRYQGIFSAGLDWLESTCIRLYGSRYLECLPAQQKNVLDRIAFRGNSATDGDLEIGIRFFVLLRKLTIGGFFTSRVGIEYLKYVGNDKLADFPGCPVPDGWPGVSAVGSQKERKS